jgi:hypothetical protein
MNLNLTQKRENLIEFATKVLTFKRDILNACMEKGIDPPTDKQITDYINGYDIDFESFMADYTEHEGMFIDLRTPLDDFKAEINSRSWVTKPTEEEILDFFNKYGNNIVFFCAQHNILHGNPFVCKVYLKTIASLSIEGLVELWNRFVGESHYYSDDSYIYNLSKKADKLILRDVLTDAELEAIDNMAEHNHTHFIEWFETYNHKGIQFKTANSIRETIAVHWNEIFERIILHPHSYELFNCGNGTNTFFTEIVRPILFKEVGIEVSKDGNKIKYRK